MNPETNTQTSESSVAAQQQTVHPVNQVTTFSKYLALGLFVLLPFIGGYVGYRLAPEKVEEINTPIITNMPEFTDITPELDTTQSEFEVVSDSLILQNNITWKEVLKVNGTDIIALAYPEILPVNTGFIQNPTNEFSGDPGLVGYYLPLVTDSGRKLFCNICSHYKIETSL